MSVRPFGVIKNIEFFLALADHQIRHKFQAQSISCLQTNILISLQRSVCYIWVNMQTCHPEGTVCIRVEQISTENTIIVSTTWLYKVTNSTLGWRPDVFNVGIFDMPVTSQTVRSTRYPSLLHGQRQDILMV